MTDESQGEVVEDSDEESVENIINIEETESSEEVEDEEVPLASAPVEKGSSHNALVWILLTVVAAAVLCFVAFGWRLRKEEE